MFYDYEGSLIQSMISSSLLSIVSLFIYIGNLEVFNAFDIRSIDIRIIKVYAGDFNQFWATKIIAYVLCHGNIVIIIDNLFKTWMNAIP